MNVEQPWWADTWKAARQKYDERVAKFGAERVHAAVDTFGTLTWAGASEMFKFGDPVLAGCLPHHVPSTCLDYVLAGNGPGPNPQLVASAEVIPTTAEELAARMPSPLREEFLDAIEKANRLTTSRRTMNAGTLIAEAAAANALLSEKSYPDCQRERTGGTIGPRLVPEWTHCSLYAQIESFLVRATMVRPVDLPGFRPLPPR